MTRFLYWLYANYINFLARLSEPDDLGGDDCEVDTDNFTAVDWRNNPQ